MRTTLDLPEELYRRLKVRAGLDGLPMKALLVRYLEAGMRAAPEPARRRPAPPVIIPPTGKLIPALSPRELRRLEEAEDKARSG